MTKKGQKCCENWTVYSGPGSSKYRFVREITLILIRIDRVFVRFVYFVHMQKTIPISELRKQVADIIDEVLQKKTTFVLVRNGKPVAKLVPADAHTDLSPAFADIVDGVFSHYAADLKKLAEAP